MRPRLQIAERGRILAETGIIMKIEPTPGHWYFEPEASYFEQVRVQIERWVSVGAVIDDQVRASLLEKTETFVPRGDGDTPLVTGGFGYDFKEALPRLWNAAFANAEMKIDLMKIIGSVAIEYTSGMEPPAHAQVRLVHFLPTHYVYSMAKGVVAGASARKQRLAGIEILEKCVVDPDWIVDQKATFMLLGLQVKQRHSDEYIVPSLAADLYHKNVFLDGVGLQQSKEEFTSITIYEC